MVGRDAVVEHEGEMRAELSEQRSRVQAHRVGDDLDDVSVPYFVAVTERTVNDVATPMLGESFDVGKFIDESAGGKNTAGNHVMTADQLDTEPTVIALRHVDDTARDDFAAIAANLLPANRRQLRRGQTFVSEVAVHVRGRSVSWLARVHDDDGSALTAELQTCSEASGRRTDDGHITVPLDLCRSAFAHAANDTIRFGVLQCSLRYSQGPRGAERS